MCPNREVLIRWLTGKLAEHELEAVYEHVNSCLKCKQLVAVLDADDSLLTGLARLDEYADVSSIDKWTFRFSLSRLSHLFTSVKEGGAVRISSNQIRDYVLQEFLGMGGMGMVFRALHLRLGREVAVKVLSPDRLRSRAAVDHFEQEMIAIGRLSHSNIVTALDAGCEEGIHYLVMELVDGITVAQLVERLGPVRSSVAKTIVLQAAHGLQHAHEQGFVHRDVKPSNLMISSKGQVQILDLGLSLWLGEKQESSSKFNPVGTPNYIAPEQINNSQGVDHLADIYSLGSTLHFLIHGSPGAPSASGESSRQQSETQHEPLNDLLDRMLAESKHLRPQSAAEVIQQLGNPPADVGLARLVQQAQVAVSEQADTARCEIPSAWLKSRQLPGREKLSKTTKSMLLTIVATVCVICCLLLTADSTKRMTGMGKSGGVPQRDRPDTVASQKKQDRDSLEKRKERNLEYVAPWERQTWMFNNDTELQDEKILRFSKRRLLSNGVRPPWPDYAPASGEPEGEQETLHEVFYIDSEYEWLLRIGNLTGLHVARKPKDSEEFSEILCETFNIKKLREKSPQVFVLAKTHLPTVNPVRASVSSSSISAKEKLPEGVIARRTVSGTQLGIQQIRVRTQQKFMWISDSRLHDGSILVVVTEGGKEVRYSFQNSSDAPNSLNLSGPPMVIKSEKDGKKKQVVYTLHNRQELSEKFPTLMELIELYAPTRQFLVPLPELNSVRINHKPYDKKEQSQVLKKQGTSKRPQPVSPQ